MNISEIQDDDVFVILGDYGGKILIPVKLFGQIAGQLRVVRTTWEDGREKITEYGYLSKTELITGDVLRLDLAEIELKK